MLTGQIQSSLHTCLLSEFLSRSEAETVYAPILLNNNDFLGDRLFAAALGSPQHSENHTLLTPFAVIQT
jgi:hypothetical protein